ncbi:MAG: GNAT family N-acetyltransferase [Dehalococcoidia bacterium]
MAVVFRCLQCGRSLGWAEATPVVNCKGHGAAPELTVERLDEPSDRVLKLISSLLGDDFNLQGNPCVTASEGGFVVGAASYSVAGGEMTVEAAAVDSQYQGSGAGAKMYVELDAIAREAGLKAIRASVTNDNALALYFHQRQGFLIDSIEPIEAGSAGPAVGLGGIPIRQRLVLLKPLD